MIFSWHPDSGTRISEEIQTEFGLGLLCSFSSSASTIKIQQYRQDELTGTSVRLVSRWVLLWTLIWGWLIEMRPIHHIDDIRCDLGSSLVST